MSSCVGVYAHSKKFYEKLFHHDKLLFCKKKKVKLFVKTDIFAV